MTSYLGDEFMKKTIIIILISSLLIGLFNISILEKRNINKHEIKNQLIFNNIQMTDEEQKEKLYKDLFIILLQPHVEKAINEYYDAYFTESLRVEPWYYSFLNIEKLPNSSYSYIMQLEVSPFIGPHLTVGLDHITFKMDLNEIIIEKFEHIESHQLPPNYQYIIKKEYPPVNKRSLQ